MYTMVRRLEAADENSVVDIEVNDTGLFRFVVHEKREEIGYDNQPTSYWAAIFWSGLYGSAEVAEREAKSTRLGLTAQISN